MKIAVIVFASLLIVALASAQSDDAAPANKPVEKTAERPAEKPAEKPAEQPPEKPTEKPPAKKPSPSAAAKKTEVKPLPADVKSLVIEDLAVGKGKIAEKGKNVKVHYTGWLYDSAQPNGRGKQFDSSLKRGEPFSFPLGASKVIKGWDEGFKDMRVGGKRRLVIPSEMAYGRFGAGNEIPPNAPLIFEVELLDVMEGI